VPKVGCVVQVDGVVEFRDFVGEILIGAVDKSLDKVNYRIWDCKTGTSGRQDQYGEMARSAIGKER